MPQFEDTGHDMDNIQFVHPIRISRSGPWRLYFLRYLTSSAKCFELSTASTKAGFRKIGSTALHKIYTKIAFTHPNFFSKEEPRYVQLQCLGQHPLNPHLPCRCSSWQLTSNPERYFGIFALLRTRQFSKCCAFRS